MEAWSDSDIKKDDLGNECPDVKGAVESDDKGQENEFTKRIRPTHRQDEIIRYVSCYNGITYPVCWVHPET
jgi:hypothetical protein